MKLSSKVCVCVCVMTVPSGQRWQLKDPAKLNTQHTNLFSVAAASSAAFASTLSMCFLDFLISRGTTTTPVTTPVPTAIRAETHAALPVDQVLPSVLAAPLVKTKNCTAQHSNSNTLKSQLTEFCRFLVD